MSVFKQVLNNNASEKSTSKKDVLFSNVNNEVLKGASVTNDSIQKTTMSKALSQEEPDIKYRFYKDTVFESVNIEQHYFTNFLPDFDAFDGYIDEGINKLKVSPSLLSKTEKRENAEEVKLAGKFINRIEAIIAEYDSLNNDEGHLIELLKDGFIRKSKIETPLGDSGALRLISVYSKDIDSQKTYFDLLFIDFYHLFIPSKHGGLSAEECAKKVYIQRKSCSERVHKYLKEDVFN